MAEDTDNKTDAKPETSSDEQSPEVVIQKGKSKIIIVIVLVILIIGALSAAVYFFFIADGQNAEGVVVEEVTEASGDGTELTKSIYVGLSDELLVSLVDRLKRRHTLRVSVVIITKDPKLQKVIEANDPVISSGLLEEFESNSYEKITTFKGRRGLRGDGLDKVRELLPQHQDKVLKIIFTKFVMD